MSELVGLDAAGAELAAPAAPVLTAPLLAGILLAAAASLAVAVRVAMRLRRGLPVVDPRPHEPAPWGGADVAVVAVVFVGLSSAALALAGPKPPLQVALAADIAAKVAGTLAGLAILRAVGASWAAVGFGGGRWRDDLRLAVGALALVLAPLLAIAAMLDRVVPYEHPVVSFLQQGRDPWAIALVVVAAVLVAPVAEEFFFRRVLQGWLEKRLPAADGAAAVGLSAVAFAAAHVGHGLAPVPLFLLGIVLGTIARATGRLAPCVLLHALFNAVGVGLLLGAPPPVAGGC